MGIVNVKYFAESGVVREGGKNVSIAGSAQEFSHHLIKSTHRNRLLT